MRSTMTNSHRRAGGLESEAELFLKRGDDVARRIDGRTGRPGLELQIEVESTAQTGVDPRPAAARIP
jgi:hypothetical protein